MATIGIIDQKALEAIKKKLADREGDINKELSKAINSAARQTINLSIIEWDAFATTRKGYLSNKIWIASGATQSRHQAIIQTASKATRADRYRYHPVLRGKRPKGERDNRGVYVNFKRGAAGGFIKGAFMRKARSDGTPLIMKRIKKYVKGESRTEAKKTFKAVYGPSPNQFFHDARFRNGPEAISEAKQQFLKAIKI